MNRQMHGNSLEAWHGGREEAFPQRARQVVNALKILGMATDRDVCARLGFKDMNAVRPRITELVKKGVLQECGVAIDAVTNRHVRVVRITPYDGSDVI